MGKTLTNADAALKEDYQPSMREQLNNTNWFLSQIERNSKDVEGRRAVLSLHVSRNSGVGARAENGTLPTAGNQGYAEERVSLRYNYGTIRLTGPVIRAMRSDSGSFVRAVDSETKGVVRDLKRDVNRQLFGTSDGVIAKINGTGSTTTNVVFSATSTAAQRRQVEIGMVIDVGTASPFTSVGTGRTVTAIAADGLSFTVSPAFAVAPATNDSIVRSGSGGSGAAQVELTGLPTIVDDANTLFNVNPTTNPVWKSYVDGNAGVNRSISDQLLQELIHNVSINGGDQVNLFVTSDGVERAYAATLTSQKRFANTLDLKGGYKALAVNAGTGEVALKWDRDAPNNKVFGLDTDHLTQHEMSDWEWMDEDGAILSRVSGVDAYEAVLFKYHELTTDKRNAHGVIEDVTEA